LPAGASQEFEEVATQFLKVNLVRSGLNNLILQRRLKLIGAHLCYKIEESDLNPTCEYFELLRTLDYSAWNEPMYRVLRPAVFEPLRRVESRLESFPPEQVDLLLARSRELMFHLAASSPSDQLLPIKETIITLNLAAGQLDVLKTELEKSNRPKISLEMDRIWSLLACKTGLSLEDRKSIIVQWWQLARDFNWPVGCAEFHLGIKESALHSRSARMGLDALLDANLIPRLELLELAPQLAEINSVDGEIWRQIGHYHLSLDQFPEAATVFQRSIESTPDNLKQALSNRRIELAFAFFKAGQFEKAKPLLKMVESEQLLEDNIARYSLLKRELGVE
jgi:tetratricopeptide (TPR) repeat protein